MNAPWNQDDPIDDDYSEGMDDEEEENGVEYQTVPVEGAPPPVRVLPRSTPQAVSKKKFRIRPMSAAMAARSQGVISILITKRDGSQVLLVRGGK